MKKKNLSLLLVLCSLGVMGCTPSKVQSESKNETKTVVGYMHIEESKVYFDEIEIITDKDTDKMEELGLTVENDLPNGYYFYNPSNKEEFLEGSYYRNVPLEEQTIPYFLEVNDGKVLSIREEFLYTQ